MRRRQAKKIIRREAARYLGVGYAAETSGDVNPYECGALTLSACVAVLRSEVATIRGVRPARHDDAPLLVPVRLHGVLSLGGLCAGGRGPRP